MLAIKVNSTPAELQQIREELSLINSKHLHASNTMTAADQLRKVQSATDVDGLTVWLLTLQRNTVYLTGAATH